MLPRLLTSLALLGTVLMAASCGGGGDRVRLTDQDRAYLASQEVAVDMDFSTGDARKLAETPFSFAWDLRLEAAPHVSWVSPSTRDKLFLQLETGEIQCIDLLSGMTLWVTEKLPKKILVAPHVARNELTDPATGKTVFDDRLYVISADYLFVFDCTYGQKIWSYHLGTNGADGFQPASGPFALGNEGSLRIYIGDWEGRIRVVTRHPSKLLPYLDWQWNLRAVPTARPEGYDMLSYVVDRQGKLSCFDLERELLWQQDCGAPLHGGPFLRGRNAYVGSEDSVFHVFNRLSGMPQGKLFMGQPITRQPFGFHAEPTSVYLWTDDQHGMRGGLSRITTVDDNIAYEDVEQFDLQVNRLSMA